MNLLKQDKKAKAAMLSILSNTSLITMKIVAGILSGSVSIISEAIHSSIDLVASLIAYVSVRMSGKPADDEHPYGHGKIENFSGLIEGLLIFVAAYMIMSEAAKKIIDPTEVGTTWIGIGVMFVSAIANTFVARNLYKVAKEEDSVALEADALHLKTDVYTSLGVGLGLIVLEVTKIAILDSIIAMCVALLIIKESYHLCVEAFKPLIDSRLSDEELSQVFMVLDEHKNEMIDYHHLCTRRSGKTKYIELHMTVNGKLSVLESHMISDKIECALEDKLRNTNVTIHVEPEENTIEN